MSFHPPHPQYSANETTNHHSIDLNEITTTQEIDKVLLNYTFITFFSRLFNLNFVISY